MNIKQKFFNWVENPELKDVKAIVIHWDALKGVPDADLLWSIFDRRGHALKLDNQKASCYHYLVSHENVINAVSKDVVTNHCSHRTYRKKAKEFFGADICGPKGSPDNNTISVCMLHDIDWYTGGYHADTMDTAIELLAGLCDEYDLDPETDILRHSDITNEKDMQCPRAFFEDDEDPDDLWRSFKNWISIEKTGLYGIKG